MQAIRRSLVFPSTIGNLQNSSEAFAANLSKNTVEKGRGTRESLV